MNDPTFAEIESWIAEAQAGTLTWSQVAERLLQMEHPEGSEHHPDRDRERRCGFGEVIFGEGKSATAIASIANRLLDQGQREVLVTRISKPLLRPIAAQFPYSRYDSLGRTLRLSNASIGAIVRTGFPPAPPSSALPPKAVYVVTAGSTDLPVAREAFETLGWMGVDAGLLTDVGVAGPYRLLPHLPALRAACALVVVAGMEGALASVVGGLVPAPIIAVPTSVGYGFNLSGITTLLSMMSSCAAGVTTVNIDAGFKGGYVAGLIAHRLTIA